MTTNNSRSQPRLPFFRRIAPVALLFFLAPLFGEYLLGNLKFSEIFLLPFLAPLYGGGAVLIREIARRFGHGYGTMLGLGVAYALIEEGLATQLLFNPTYFVGQEGLMHTTISLLGIDAWLTLTLIAMHTVWSICIPIVLVEAIYKKRGDSPWLGKAGFAVVAVISILGTLWIAHENHIDTGFMASLPQLVSTAIIATAIIAATLLAGRRKTMATDGTVPNPWLVSIVAFAASSLFMLTESLPGWTKVGACLIIAASFFVLILRWSHQSNWGFLHTLALVRGGIATYAWLGIFMEPESGPKTLIDHIGSVFIVAFVYWLLFSAGRKQKV